METERRVISNIITGRLGVRPTNLELDRKCLSNGAEATNIALVTARYLDHLNRPNMLRIVAKRLDGRAAREAAVYEGLVSVHAAQIAPEFLAVVNLGPDSRLIFLEAVRKISAWPWRDALATGDLLACLGEFHTAVEATEVVLPEWNYEGELAAMAESTWSMLDQCRGNPEFGVLARHLPQLGRMIDAQAELRQQLLSLQPFGCRPIHGDVHPGNALVRRRGGTRQPVLIDWGRARLGSPLQDVSSWLQSLRFWDAEAQRIHDRLFAMYLSAFGMQRKLTSELRAAYWTAGASNALAGALLHHLLTVVDPGQSKARRVTAFSAARDWLRIIRRAHAWTM